MAANTSYLNNTSNKKKGNREWGKQKSINRIISTKNYTKLNLQHAF